MSTPGKNWAEGVWKEGVWKEGVWAQADGPDITPDPFSFTPRTGVPLASEILSDVVTITGINTTTPVSVTGGEYRIDGGAWSSSPGTIENGQQIQVRHTSSADHGTATATTLTVGTSQAIFTSVTLVLVTEQDVAHVGRKHRGWNQKRTTLRLSRDRAFTESIRRIYRDLTANPKTRKRAQEIVTGQSGSKGSGKKGTREQSRENAFKRLLTLSVEAEIALYMLYDDLQQIRELDDMQAIGQLLTMVL